MNDILELVQQFAGQQDEPFDRGQPVNSSDIAWIGQKAAVINARHLPVIGKYSTLITRYCCRFLIIHHQSAPNVSSTTLMRGHHEHDNHKESIRIVWH